MLHFFGAYINNLVAIKSYILVLSYILCRWNVLFSNFSGFSFLFLVIPAEAHPSHKILTTTEMVVVVAVALETIIIIITFTTTTMAIMATFRMHDYRQTTTIISIVINCLHLPIVFCHDRIWSQWKLHRLIYWTDPSGTISRKWCGINSTNINKPKKRTRKKCICGDICTFVSG